MVGGERGGADVDHRDADQQRDEQLVGLLDQRGERAGRPALLLGQRLSRGAPEREVGGLGAGEQRRAAGAGPARAQQLEDARRLSVGSARTPRASRPRAPSASTKTTSPARPPRSRRSAVSAVPVASARPACSRSAAAGSQRRAGARSPRRRPWPTRRASAPERARAGSRAAASTGTPIELHPGAGPLSRQMWREVGGEAVGEIHHRVDAAGAGPASAPPRTRARGRRCAARDLGQPRAGEAGARARSSPRSSSASPAAERPRLPVTATASPARAVRAKPRLARTARRGA